jgi:hypothetical protein
LWFGHLQNDDPLFIFDSDFSFAKDFAPLQIEQPWMRQYNTEQQILVVNKFYPLDYFDSTNITQLSIEDPSRFWASDEAFAPSFETLTIDFGVPRPLNFLDFEIGQKPIDFTFEYWNGSTWVPLNYSSEFQPKESISYLPSLNNTWAYIENHFDLATTQFVRITFTRREETFPFIDSDPIAWSIDVRNLHAAHVIVKAEDFVVDAGIDILGNTYRTDLVSFEPTIASGQANYWQSQPNPVPDAVEALYFDLRQGTQTGTMTYLDTADFLGDYNTRGMADMEIYRPNSVVVDEVYIDPVTFGPTMHIYYSNDDTPEWDDKLWIPIPRHFVLKRGFHTFPSPVACRYIKLEFSNLVPTPYQQLEYPHTPEITYRRFPTWVQNHFDIELSTSMVPNPFDRVVVDPLELGFVTADDRLSSDYVKGRSARVPQPENEIRDFVQTLTNQTAQSDQTDMETRINYFPSFMYQQDLMAQLDDTSALSRFLLQRESDINSEALIDPDPAPNAQSVPDLTKELERKRRPAMFFPRSCRHQYQVLKGSNQQKLAYFVGVNQVGFYRRDFTVAYDEPVYYETLDDAAHISLNEFVSSSTGYVVTP